MIKVVADSIESSPENNGYIAFLREENGSLFFPIFLDGLHGANLCYALHWANKETPKAGSNFIKAFMNLTNLQVEKVVINDLQNNDYHAEIFIKKGKFFFYALRRYKCYPAIALNLAAHLNAPIYVTGEAMKKGEILKTEEPNLFDDSGILYQEEGITIKLADESNAEFIHKLYMDVLQMYANELPEVYKTSSDSSFSVSHITDLMAIPSNYFFIGCKDNELIGYVHTQVRYLAETPSRHSMRCLYICQMAVKPDYQKKGYGRRLLQAVEELATAEGVKVIDLAVWSFNKGAREFFIKQGFMSLNETMSKSISG